MRDALLTATTVSVGIEDRKENKQTNKIKHTIITNKEKKRDGEGCKLG